MLIWNRKDFVKKAVKTTGLFFKFGDEVPEDELAEGVKEGLIAKGYLIEKKAKVKAPKEAPKPKPVYKPKPMPLPEKTKSKPKPKPTKKGRR